MKKISLLLHVLIGACLLIGCADNRMRYANVLNQAERQNADFDSITNLDSIKLAVEFMDAHGSANERIRAHYLLGCAYRDLGDAPQAIENYQNAVNCADTTAIDCDYRQLSKVHSQMANLFYQQLLPYESLEELELQYNCAIRAGNIKSSINAIEHKSGVYELLDMPDSVIKIRKTAYQLYKQNGFDKEATLSVGAVINVLLDRDSLKMAKYYMDIYEKEWFDYYKGLIRNSTYVYYYDKGKYYLATGNPDSAMYFFRILLDPTLDDNLHEAGYRGLYLLYKSIGQKDSLAKYADLSYQLNEASYASKATRICSRCRHSITIPVRRKKRMT